MWTGAEGGGAVRCAQAARSVVAGPRGAGEGGGAVGCRAVAAHRAVGAAGVVALGHVVEGAGRLVGVGGRVRSGDGGAGQRVHACDDRRGGAGAPVDVPAAVREGVVDRHAGGRVRDGADVRDRAARAVDGRLEGGFGLDVRAARAGRAPVLLTAAVDGGRVPHRLVPAAGTAVAHQRGAAHRRHVRRGRRVAGAVAVVTGAEDDRDSWMIEVRLVVSELAAVVAVAAPGVGDVARAQGHGGVLGRAQVVGGRAVGLDEQEVRVGCDRGDHVEVEGDLARPAVVCGRVGGGAVFVHLAEAAVVRGAGGQPVLPAVDGEIGLGAGVVVGVDDGDRGPGPAVGRQPVGRAQVGRGVAVGVRLVGRGAAQAERGRDVGAAQGETREGAGSGRAAGGLGGDGGRRGGGRFGHGGRGEGLSGQQRHQDGEDGGGHRGRDGPGARRSAPPGSGGRSVQQGRLQEVTGRGPVGPASYDTRAFSGRDGLTSTKVHPFASTGQRGQLAV